MLHGPAAAADASQRLLQMLDYVGVDYPPTVSAGEVVDPVEYAEMVEFSAVIIELLSTMPDHVEKAGLLGITNQIKMAVEQRQPGAQLANLTQQAKEDIIRVYSVVVGPGQIPDMSRVQSLFEAECTSCHGYLGYGDGPAASGMQPAPSNFHEHARQASRSIYDLYNTISLGVPGTAMPSFAQLSEEQRWSLAFMVGQLSSSDALRETGDLLWQQGRLHNEFQSLTDLTSTSFAKSAEAARANGLTRDDGTAILAYLRSNPSILEVDDHVALDKTIAMLATSVELARAGQRGAAHEAALSAYLDGFELAEPGLIIADKKLKTEIEKAMYQFREQALKGEVGELEQTQIELLTLLKLAKKRLSETEASPAAAFAGAFIILLREGVEAILVLAAIMAALIKTGRREALKYIHAGWIAAVVLGVFTWWVAENLIAISGASRELTEGFAALFAAVILVYVGFWLHNASCSKRWKQYVEHKIDNAMEGSTLWVLAFVSFLAVYREMFETVLFYQSMWLQLEPAAHQGFVFGVLMAVVALVVLSFLIFRAGTKLPIGLFFQINAVLLFLLAVVFSGQGISALQEAGMVAISSINFPQVEILGIYPTLQSLGLQIFVLLVGIVLLLYQRKIS